ncbi:MULTISPECIES: DUF359 domain-containing protein [Acidiplasma]|jgi:uncharacterized protein (UPF0218 family)|uniref:GTP-dependent dephospho-CoA kinase n=2 Tax=Acidiplasma TaxID=507753 RepID=A0A0Q0RMV9_9ARCH|nr:MULTISPECIES: DUF359 domain-containing protein [Acidiplasma]KJE49755.1 hypothetical protein TZ01_01235 [Acidiplasma sp. MBA-1]KPV46191.1 hypothetical protein SE19_06605 [Acidiplasma aeolicum]KQB33546.1 hypothetical protein AOG55_02590 [Acidiplasma cupricumulans]KQB34755.1 hypothetical protein AOG54_00570 [Acidiplasma aeolicum]WMT55710.1 MAG: DUF359 domain-containing protein [Acidiplasma sp.]
MRLKLDHDIVLTPEIIDHIKNFKHNIASPDDIIKLSKEYKIIAVGDVTTENLKNHGVNIFLQVVDLITKRNEGKFQHIEGSIAVKNPAGTISLDLINAIKTALTENKPSRIEVSGEEDLAVIPIIFYADLNTVIVYGIPDIGMAYIKVNKAIRDDVEKLLGDVNV